MMTLPSSTAAENFKKLTHRLRLSSSDDALAKLRTASWERLEGRKLPTTGDEAFQYVSLRKFEKRTYVAAQVTEVSSEAIDTYILPECQHSVVVFVNGHFEPSLSSMTALPQVVLAPLATAYRTYGTFLSNQWQRTLQDEQDPWALVNAALHPQGAFIYIPPRTVVSQPIQVLSIIDAREQPMLVLPRYHLFLGAGSEASVVTQQAVISGQGYIALPACDIAIEDNARLTLTQLALAEHADAWHGEACRFTLKRDSFLESVAIVQGGESSRHDYRVTLLGENGEAHLNGLAMLSGTSEAHVHVHISHAAPHCRSLQLFKNVLRDSARASFEGKIYVHSAAQKTDAFQLNNNLLLSSGAQVSSKPNLEIFADDVKASHGATMGQLDKEQLFYLLARGLDRATAQHILIQGFCRVVLDKISLPVVAHKVKSVTANYISAAAA